MIDEQSIKSACHTLTVFIDKQLDTQTQAQAEAVHPSTAADRQLQRL